MRAAALAAALRPLRDDLFIVGADGAPVALRGTRCTDCGRVAFPARALCSHCAPHGQLVPHRLSAHGVVHASTVARVPSAMGHAPPYAYGYVDLPDDATRIFAPFSGAEAAWFQPGARVRVAFGEIPAAAMRGVLGYWFVPDAPVTADG